MPTIAELLQAALDHDRAGRSAQVEAVCRQILKDDPRPPEALSLLGTLALGSGQYALALRTIEQVLAIDPGRASSHFDRGEVYRRLGRRAEAQASYEQALRLDPQHVTAQNNLGIVHQERGELDEAEAAFRKAARIGPDQPFVLNNLGTILLGRWKLDEARTFLERAIQLRPDYAEAHNNLGAVAMKLGRFDEAHASFVRALTIKPGFATALNNLGTVLYETGRYTEAATCLEQALRISPTYVDALIMRARVAAMQGQAALARAAIDRALAIQPTDVLKLRSALLLPAIYESSEHLHRERTRLEADLARLATESLAIENPVDALGSTPFFLAYQGKNDRELLESLATILREAAPELEYVAPHCRESRKDGPIRVGWISHFFFNHTIGKLNLGFVRNLSRERFSVTLFRFPGPDDPLARALDEAADKVVNLPRRLELARQMIADEHLDILYYANIGMDPWTYFLAFARLAPIQCVSWGHPVTTGLPAIDYFLSAALLEPKDAEEHYTEALIRPNKINTYYFEPKISSPIKDRAALGLPEDAHLYVCSQSLFKIHPDFDTVLGQILRGDPNGRLVLIEGMCADWRPLLLSRFRRTFPGEVDRVIFVPRLSQEDFLHLQARADVLLDTTHFGGGNTSYEAFAFGTPIVTRAGAFLRDRITYACYRQMGLADCVATSDADYVRIALRLGTDPAWREQVRAEILARKHRLYEDPVALQELEAFFLGAVARVRGI
jgi:predicted O-linked N-acetylglucosamine transferase (SPINDLY family)